MRRRVTALLASLLDGLLYALTAGAALALGGVHVPATVALAVLSALFVALAIGNHRGERRVRALPLPFWALGLAAIWALVQALPLGGALGGLSGTPAELFALAGEPVARLAANATAAAQTALFFATAALAYAAAYNLFEPPERLNRLTTALIASAAIVTLVALVQAVLGERALLFFYEPQMGPLRPGLQGSFVNPDHFGAFAAVGAVLALGRAEGLRAERVHHAYDALAALLVAGLVLSYSLTALLAFAVGMVALFFTWRAQNLRVGNPFASGLPALTMGAALAAGLYVVGVAPSPGPAIEAQIAALGQLTASWSATLGVIADNVLVGIGGGGLGDLLTAHQSDVASRVSFARNEPLQLLVDFGVPLGGLVLMAVLAVFSGTRTRWHSEDAPAIVPIAAGLWTLAALALVDFALRIPAIGIAAALLAGALASQVRRYRRRFTHYQRTARRVEALTRRLPATAALVALGVVVVGGGALALQLDRAFDRAHAALYAPPTASAELGALTLELESRASDVLSLRPGLGRAYSVTGARFLEAANDAAHGAQALGWLERAATLLPTDPPTLFALGLAQLATGAREAGLATLGDAVRLDSSLAERAARELIRRFDDRALWRVASAALTPAARASGDAEDPVFSALFGAGRAADALALADDRLRADPGDDVALAAAARAALTLRADLLARHLAGALLRRDTTNPAAHLVMAAAEQRTGDWAGAIARLEALLTTHPDDLDAWLSLGTAVLGRAEAGAPLDASAEETMERVRAALRERMMIDGALTLEYHWLSARYFVLTEHWRAAESAALRAIEVAPARADLHRLLARALDGLEDNEGALAARARAAELTGARPPREAE
jgi:hypothetical protein